MKITTMCPQKELERVIQLLRLQHGYPEFNPSWKEETLPNLDQGIELNLADRDYFIYVEAAKLPRFPYLTLPCLAISWIVLPFACCGFSLLDYIKVNVLSLKH